MPLPTRIVLQRRPEGMVGVCPDGREVPVGILRGDDCILLLRQYEDEREHCEHCDGLFCIDTSADSDDRCGRCNKSHRECNGCDRTDTETCIHCDSNWCTACWNVDAHTGDCEGARQHKENNS